MRAISLRVFFSLLLTGVFSSFVCAQDGAGPQGTTLYVKLTQNREISGTSVGLSEIKVTTSFGEVVIPMAKINGVKMRVDANDSAVIAFKNGDLVTGTLKLDVVKLKTDWGTAHVKTSQIDTVMLSRDARFYPDANGGAKGWRFTSGGPITTAGNRVYSGNNAYSNGR